MSDKFYDFDKDDSFDEVYSDKIKKRPVKKEFEITIPAPQSELKSTIPQKPEGARKATFKKMPEKKAQPSAKTPPQKAAKPPKKKMSTGKKVLCAIGIILSCIIVYLGSLVVTLFGWNHLPSFKEEEKSVVHDVEKIDEYVEISDDGTSVEVVPMYKDVPGSSSSSGKTEETDKSDKKDEEDTDDDTDGETDSEADDEGDVQEPSSESTTSPETSGGDNEVINID